MEIQERIHRAAYDLAFLRVLAELREDYATLKALIDELKRRDHTFDALMSRYLHIDLKKRFEVTIDDRPWEEKAYIDFYGGNLSIFHSYGAVDSLGIMVDDRMKQILSQQTPPFRPSPIPKFFKSISLNNNFGHRDVHVSVRSNGIRLRITVFKEYSAEIESYADYPI